MTTLPQIPTIRPPQPIGLPAGHLSPATVGAGAVVTMTGRDVWRILRSNLWLMIVMMILFGVGGYGLHYWWQKNWPVYTARGLILINRHQMRDPLSDRYDELADVRVLTEQRTQAQVLFSSFGDFLKEPTAEVEGTAWYAGFSTNGELDTRRARQDLEDHFKASPIPDSGLIQVSFSSSKSDDCQTVLRDVCQRHIDQEREKAGKQLDEQRKLLNDREGSLSKELSKLESGVAALRGRIRTSVAVETELREFINAHLKAAADEQQARSRLTLVKSKLKDGQPLADVERAVAMDPSVSQLSRELMGLQIQARIKELESGREHPDVKRYVNLVKETEAALRAREDEARRLYTDQLKDGLEAEQMSNAEMAKNLKTEIERREGDLKGIAQEAAQLESDVEKVRRLTELKQQILDRIQTLDSIQKSASQAPIMWARPPEKPDTLTWPRLVIILPLAMVLGLMFAVGIAFLREILDDTVRTPRDVSRVGQLNLLGIIADSADDPQAEDARLAIFDAPHSLTAEQFRQVRTRMQQAASLDQNHSLLVTGPSPLDGKTTVAANLAAGLALNGRKILLVDANFRKPELHRLFGFDNAQGFSDVLNGTAPLAQAAQATRIPNLSVLTSGAKPANATELLESQLLSDFIENACREYDHVIFDSGPMLIVSESAALAPRVDGVITVVRAHAESRGLLLRMREALRQLKAEHIGVVLNAVRSRGGGYYRRNIKAYYRYQSER